MGEESARTTPSRCASTSTSTPTSRPTTSPTSRRRSTCTAGSPAPREVADLQLLRDELEDRFGPVPEPLVNLIALQQARIKLGQAGRARSPSAAGASRSRRSSSTPTGRKSCARRSPGALYEPGTLAVHGARARRARASASRRSSARPTRCSRSRARRRDAYVDASLEARVATLGGLYAQDLRLLRRSARTCRACRRPLRLRRQRPRQRRRARSATTSITQAPSSTTGCRWPRSRRRAPLPGQKRAEVKVPEPPDFAECVAEQAEDRAQAGQGPAQADRRAVQDAVQAGVRGPARPGPAVPDLRRVDPGRGRRPGRQGHRRRGPASSSSRPRSSRSRRRRTSRSSSRTRA